jgi:hypothetical protein
VFPRDFSEFRVEEGSLMSLAVDYTTVASMAQSPPP